MFIVHDLFKRKRSYKERELEACLELIKNSLEQVSKFLMDVQFYRKIDLSQQYSMIQIVYHRIPLP